jgi:AraC-like DNA-binding protein
MESLHHKFISADVNGVSFTIVEIAAPLNQFVQSIWASNGIPGFEKERILPDGMSTMIFNFGGPVKIQTGAMNYSVPNNFFSGIASGFIDTFCEGKHNQAGITFKPGGAFELLKIPLHQFGNSIVELDLIAKNKFSVIYDKMQNEPTPEGRLSQLYNWLVANLKHAKPDLLVNKFIAHLQTEDELSMKNLAGKFSISPQHMGRLLNKYIGTNPKMLHRILRFQKAIHSIQSGSSKNLTDTAYETNYFDQAHFINEFNSFAGLTPKKVSSYLLPANPRLLIF